MSDDQRTLFEQELSDARSLASSPRVAMRKRAKGQDRNRAQVRANAVSDSQTIETQEAQPVDLYFVEPYEHLEWKNTGVQPETMNKLKSGRYPIQERLDLHNQRVVNAFQSVMHFLSICLEKQLRTVLIVHGVGLKSTPPAQLKSHIAHWLKHHAKVNAYVTAPAHLGGAGATLVHLKKSLEAKLETKERIARCLG